MKKSGDLNRSFRFVCKKSEIPLAQALMTAEGYRFESEPFSDICQKLVHEPFPLGSSLASVFGLIYIQDRSSMLPPLALNPSPGAFVLDMCASPGSKTGFLAQLVGPGGAVLANDSNQTRLATLRANLERSGYVNAATSAYSGESLPLPENSCPYILLDPPCSGWGTVKKNPLAAKIWQGKKTLPLIALQKSLLLKAFKILAPGGLLIYSTCTTNYAENEEQTAFAEDIGFMKIPLDPFPGFVYEVRTGGEGCLLVDGKASNAQGFYLSLLKKPEASAPDQQETPVNKILKAIVIEKDKLRSEICDPDLLPPGKILKFDDKIRFQPQSLPELNLLRQLPLIGEMKENFSLAPRMRSLLSANGSARLDIDEISQIRALLSGQSLQTGLAGTEAGLWWHNLPLGKIGLKSGRAIAAFK